jgi:hypothetical protein
MMENLMGEPVDYGSSFAFKECENPLQNMVENITIVKVKVNLFMMNITLL